MFNLRFQLKCLFVRLFVKPFVGRPQYNKRFSFVICAIFKNEALFLKEWIEYHSLLGTEHFYLYNNNSSDDYLQVLQPYVDNGLVTLIDWPHAQGQVSAYSDFIARFKNESQWASFLDIDEFICPRNDSSILSWVKKHDRYPALCVYWKMFGTSGMMNHDNSKLLIEQYHVSWPHLYDVGKCFFNTDYDVAALDASLHHKTQLKCSFFGFSFSLPVLDQFGHFYHSQHAGDTPYMILNDQDADIQINHYWSKAWDCYDKKRKGSDPFFAQNPKSDMKYFFRHECCNSSVDYNVYRFIMALKLRLNNID